MFREFNGRQMKWRSDKSGVVHACEGSIIQGGDMRLWTLCFSTVRILVPAQPVDATQALNLAAGVSNFKV